MAKVSRNTKTDKHADISKIRHSASHILAEAVLALFPKTKLGIGPATAEGFYYDFEFEKPLSENDLARIEKKMLELIAKGRKFHRSEGDIKTALKNARADGHPYKAELIEGLVAKGHEKVSFYTSGNFTDLCEGPHVKDTKEIGAIKLLSLAGAYWRGDEKNKQLTRIYGTAFATQKELDAYLKMLEEAKKRDHRLLGERLDLFTFSELVGAGLPLFTPKGTLVRELIVKKIQDLQADYGYQRVTIPHITKKDLYETSGHWQKFKDDLFHVKGVSDTEFVMKPMNCPHHTQLYAAKQRSYKDLPIRFMETTMVYRDEQAGELMGLSRVRSISQDDGHVFCTLDQVEDEARNIVKVIKSFYSALGMFKKGGYWVSLSVRDMSAPEKYLGDAKDWDKAEQILETVAKKEKLDFKQVDGEAAFYGPKLDFMFKDSIGREWQLGTCQIDFSMPSRFGLEYTDAKGQKQTPVMLHRAVAGSLERFMAIILEHFAGVLPLWLSPVQVKILPITDKSQAYLRTLAETLAKANLRFEIDERNESIGKKIRDAELSKTPYMLIVGDKEIKAKKVAVRHITKGDLGVMPLSKLLKLVGDEEKHT